jgi:multidrug efflux system membrane fusion protein
VKKRDGYICSGTICNPIIYLVFPYNTINKTPFTIMSEINKSIIASSRPLRQRLLERWWIWLLLVILLGLGAYFFLRPSTGNPQQGAATQSGGGRRGGGGQRGAVPVVVPATAKTGDINVYLNGLGAVTPQATVTIKTHISGTLMKVLFTEGQTVKRDQLIAIVDPRPTQVALELAEGTMAHDVALLQNARVDLVRYQTLYKQDSIQEQQLATQDALVRQYEAQVKVDQAGIDAQKLNLVYCNITSPVTGRVGLRLVDPGNIVNPADATGIVVITQLQPITVVFAIPEDNIPGVMQKLQTGIKMPVDTFDRSQNHLLASGYLLTLDNEVNPATGTVNLKAQFSNDNYALFPSQFVNSRLLLDTKHGATIIPSSGVQHGSQGTYVYVINQDLTVSLRLVKVGVTEGDNSSIDEGLKAGETVVIDGADKLRDGLKVEVASNDAKPADAAGDGTHTHGGHGHGKNGGAPGGEPAAPTSAAPSAAASSDAASTAAPDANAKWGGEHRHHRDGSGAGHPSDATHDKTSAQGGT